MAGTPQEACGTLTAAAGRLGTKPKRASRTAAVGASGFGCTFEPVEAPKSRPNGYSEREIAVSWATYKPEEAFRASETMGRDVLALRNGTANDAAKPSPFYELPVGDVGYALHHVPGHGTVTAGYLLDGRTYVHIEISGYRSGASGVEPLPEDVLLEDLATFLTGAAG